MTTRSSWNSWEWGKATSLLSSSLRLFQQLEGTKRRGEGTRIVTWHVSLAVFNCAHFQKYGHPLEISLYEWCFWVLQLPAYRSSLALQGLYFGSVSLLLLLRTTTRFDLCIKCLSGLLGKLRWVRFSPCTDALQWSGNGEVGIAIFHVVLRRSAATY